MNSTGTRRYHVLRCNVLLNDKDGTEWKSSISIQRNWDEYPYFNRTLRWSQFTIHLYFRATSKTRELKVIVEEGDFRVEQVVRVRRRRFVTWTPQINHYLVTHITIRVGLFTPQGCSTEQPS